MGTPTQTGPIAVNSWAGGMNSNWMGPMFKNMDRMFNNPAVPQTGGFNQHYNQSGTHTVNNFTGTGSSTSTTSSYNPVTRRWESTTHTIPGTQRASSTYHQGQSHAAQPFGP